MLNVIYDLHATGDIAGITRTLNRVRDKCDDLGAIVSQIFMIDDIDKFRPARRTRRCIETKKASFVNRHDDDERNFASSFFDSVINWESTRKDKSAVGFVVFVDANSELMNIVLVNTDGDEWSWASRHGCLKDQYADDFADAHETICEILKFMAGIGIVKNVEDRFEYYGKWDWNHALDKWQEIMTMIFKIAARGLKKNGDSVVIGGRWHVARDDGSDVKIVVKEIR